MRGKVLLSILLMIILLVISDCIETTLDYSIVVRYVPGDDIPKIANGDTIMIAKFSDVRADQTGIAATKNVAGNIETRFTSSKPLSTVVQEAFGAYFEKAGFKVVAGGFWDLNPETLKDITTELALGGEIKAFWTENKPSPNTDVGGTGFAIVKLKVVIVAPDDKTVIWSGELEGGTTSQGLFTIPSLRDMIEKALKKAIESTLNDPGLCAAIEEAIAE